MKRIMILSAILFGGLTISGFLNRPLAAEPPTNARFGFFYSSLSPYGEWIEVNGGTHIWRPFNIPREWRPYSLGRWEWTDEGWYWFSNEHFGWIVYHYGRWYYDDFYGWVWMPDDVWAPSWVEWRSNDDCIGWAPLTPYAIFDFSSGLHYSRHWRAPEHYWSFVRYERFTRNFQHADFMNRSDVHRVFGSTHTAANFGIEHGRIVNHGFAPDEISQHGNIRFEQRMISERQAPGEHYARLQESRIEVYRPSPSELRQSAVSPNFRRGERPLSGDFQTDPGMLTPASGIGPDHGSSHVRSLHIQTNTAYKDRLNVRPVKGQQKEMRQQLIKRYERDRNSGPALHRFKEKTGRRD